MNIRRVVERRIERRIGEQGKGVNTAGDVHAVERDAEGEAEITEPGMPPIDEDVAGSVNAALPEADD
jgi:hypothetical protein